MLYRNRYYCTNTGRFVTRDPIGYDAEDVNLYRYLFNRPLNQTDPNGFQGFGVVFPPGDFIAQQPLPNRPRLPVAPKLPEGKQQNKGKPFETNGCTLVPDSPYGFDFKPACDTHDICYETCGASKGDCDENFFIDMYNICNNQSRGDFRACVAMAAIYAKGVSGSIGDTAYKDAQDGWCEDKCPK